MNIHVGRGTGGAVAAAVPPTPPVDPDNDDRIVREGDSECTGAWDAGGYVALANFNQVCRVRSVLYCAK